VERVFEMLRYQGRVVTLSGGLEARLINDWFVNELRTVPVNQIFLSCDTDQAIKPLSKAVKMIGLPRNKVRCYVLLAYEGETMEQGLRRLEHVYEAGALPFAQLYQPPDQWIDYSKEWRDLARTWSRPAATKAMMKEFTECQEMK